MGGGDGYVPLFETKEARGRIAYRVFAASMLLGICLIWVFRAAHVPKYHEAGGGRRRWVWFGMFGAEVWFGLYWILTQSVRWKPVYRYTFNERLSQRQYKGGLPAVDVFVCTADPTVEPPMLVINTVLSLMAHDYPSNQLAIYLSDDGGSHLTFYALLEASSFAKYWIPFCKECMVDPRSPAAYFSHAASEPHDPQCNVDDPRAIAIKKLYDEMEMRIKSVVEHGRIPEEIQATHTGFSEWDCAINSKNHQTILQILVDGRDPNAVDVEGNPMPTLVYLSREKRPDVHHNFKAGAMNALIRVSSVISNGSIILNVDCDMYCNNAAAVRNALCFFMDEGKGRQIGYVQHPQRFLNITKNDLYANSFRVISKVQLSGMDALGGPLYVGTGCFFRRACFSEKYKEDVNADQMEEMQNCGRETMEELVERAKAFANCSYELGTQWGKEMGVRYGCVVENIATGLAIQCNGWKSIYYDPPREAFLGLAPVTLLQSLAQHKRWVEGHLQIFFSHRCPFIQGHGKIKLPLQMAYSLYNMWAVHCIPILFYVSIPPLHLLHGNALFPEIRSPWFIPFCYVVSAKFAYSLGEHLWHGETFRAWWNDQRIWMYRRTTSCLFGAMDFALDLLGITKSTFNITAKVADQGLLNRYEQEIMEFGCASTMFDIIATLSMINLVCLVGAMGKRVFMDERGAVGPLVLQFAQCGMWVMINLLVYEALFWRTDGGRLPPSVALTSTALALLACVMPMA